MDGYTAHPDLSDQPWANPDLVLYTDKVLVKEGLRYAEYAIVVDLEVPESGQTPRNSRTQLAEPI